MPKIKNLKSFLADASPAAHSRLLKQNTNAFSFAAVKVTRPRAVAPVTSFSKIDKFSL